MWTLVTLAQPLDQATSTFHHSRAHRWFPGLCVWCGDNEDLELSKNEPRCATCRQHESLIDEARQFIGMYGLRPIGGSLDSDDEEEREHRQNARDSRSTLNSIKMAEPPTREQVRKALDSKADSAVRRVEALAEAESDAAPQDAVRAPARAPSASAARAARTPVAKPDASTSSPRAAGRSSRAVDVDLATLESRVTGLLEKLTTIEGQLAEHSSAGNDGLAVRARVKDLERQRTTVLHTLAALEKARRLQTQ